MKIKFIRNALIYCIISILFLTAITLAKKLQIKLKVIVENASIHSKPNIESEIIVRVPLNTIILTGSKMKSWYEIEFPSELGVLIKGYIFESDVEEVTEGPPPAEMLEFPWPPPRASAFHKIPNNMLVMQDTASTFGDIANRIETALNGAGYTQISYYAVPDGFAMVTQLEQIEEDREPKEPGRWSVTYQPPTKFTLRQIIRSLFNARRSLWRVTVFVVTSHDFEQKEVDITPEEALEWLGAGMIRLPPSIARINYSDSHYCTALIYEFEQTRPNQEAEFKSRSEITGKQHLERGGIWRELGGTQ